MSITAFLNVRDRVEETDGFNVTFDIVTSETTSDSNTITRHPVEFGANIADHTYVNARKWTMNYVVSNTPFNAVTIAPGVTEELTRAGQAWQVLQRIRNAGQIFDLQTNLEIQTNVTIASLDVTQDKDTSNILAFTANLEEIIVVQTELVEFPADQVATTIQKQIQSNVKGGRKQKEKVINQSTLLQLAEQAAQALGIDF